MADKIKSESTNNLVRIKVPRNGKEDTMFVGCNFKNYLLKRGEYVEVPPEVAEIIERSQQAEDEAESHAMSTEDAYLEKAANPTKLK